jgi:hypothetical protein
MFAALLIVEALLLVWLAHGVVLLLLVCKSAGWSGRRR